MFRPLTVLTAAAVLATPALAVVQKKGKAPVLTAGRVAMAAPVEEVAVQPAPTTTIAQALPTIATHATLNRLVVAAKLDTMLAGPGPYTIFAPADEAFARMPAGGLDTLLQPANQPVLESILKYHVVAGKLTAEQLKAMITQGSGTASIPTLNGQPLIATLDPSGSILLTDPNGGKSFVTQADVAESNGVVHLTNGVNIPKIG